MNSRELILEGKLELPRQIVELSGSEYATEMEAMFQAIWYNYLKNKGSISSVYWSDRFNNPVVFNKFVMHLSKAGWIESIVEPKRNWAEIRFNENKLDKWVTAKEVLKIREQKKFIKYQLTDKADTVTNKVKTADGVKHTGLVREGFAKASTVKFKYDTAMIEKYREAIELNLTKSMRMLKLEYGIFTDTVDYLSISKAILEYHMTNPDKEFCLEGNISDSRGRAIHKALGKVFNPISFKDARALLVCEPKPLSLSGLINVYLAIAELLKLKPNTLKKKAALGKEAYDNRTLPELDLDSEEDRKELHSLILLERLYDALDNKRDCFDVMIETDATASMLGIEGVLLNHKPFLEMTNLLGDTLSDAWSFNGIDRTQFKKAMTPLLYGSSKDCRTLWKQNKISYDIAQVKAFNREIRHGALSVADKFKSFIINNVKPKEVMTVKIWDEEFQIMCNRYKNIGEYTKRYDVYSTKLGRVETIYHTHTKRVADLEQFKRYFVTLLIHNLDSQIANRICVEVDGVLPIHDAFLAHPNEISKVKEMYCQVINKIYANRDRILSDYFSSIGIDSKASVEWTELSRATQPVNNNTFSAQRTALK